jgi:hypothetical protein
MVPISLGRCNTCEVMTTVPDNKNSVSVSNKFKLSNFITLLIKL